MPQNDISLYAPTQQAIVGGLSTGRGSDKPWIFSLVGAEMGIYHISDMIPVALPPCVASDGLTSSLFLVPRTLDSKVHYVSFLSSINTVMYARQISLVDRSSSNTHIEAEYIHYCS